MPVMGTNLSIIPHWVVSCMNIGQPHTTIFCWIENIMIFQSSGSETSRAGLAMLFEMLQFPSLNKRLVIVILEGVIKTVFPEQVRMQIILIVIA